MQPDIIPAIECSIDILVITRQPIAQTLMQIGKEVGCCNEQARKILRRTYEKLRRVLAVV